jgi:Peptidase family M23
MRNRSSVRQIGVLATAAVLLVAAACSSDSSTNTTTPPTTTAGTASATTAADGGGSIDVIRVPDAFTAVTVRSLSTPTYPFKGSDGKYHIAYDIELTNASPAPAVIVKIDVVDAASPTTVIDTYSGLRLVDPACLPGDDCNRLRLLPRSRTKSTEIGPQESRIVYIDLTFDSEDELPKAVLHHLYATAIDNPKDGAIPVPVNYLAAPFDVSAGTPRVIGPPVKGDSWVAVNGCCMPGFAHRGSMAQFNGMLINSQRFAIDWKQINEAGAFFEGDKTKNESFVDYGAEVIAVADGTITSTLDELVPNTPGVLPARDPVLASQLTINNVDGNFIIQDIGDSQYGFYAHLQKGSLLVKPGDTVKKGQVIAKLGNTGNSSVPHMHFHLMNGPSALGSDGLPYEIDAFEYAGQVDLTEYREADDYLSGTFPSGRLATPEPRTDELPLLLAVVNFPG